MLGDFVLFFHGDVPVDGLVQAVHEHGFGFPAEELLGEGVIGHTIERAGRHFGVKFELGFFAHVAEDFAGRVDDLDAFHGAEIDGSGVVDFFGDENGAADDVVDVGPVADLLAGAPDDERILVDEGAGDHGDDGVIFDAARSVDSEVTA